MTVDQLPTEIDYAMTAPTPVIIALVSAIAAIILFSLLIVAMNKYVQTWIQVTVFIGVVVAMITGMLSMQVAYEDLARFRAEAVSQHLDETYGVDVGFTENGVPRTIGLDGRTVHDGGSVYTITVATDGSILLVDEGGKEVPRITQ